MEGVTRTNEATPAELHDSALPAEFSRKMTTSFHDLHFPFLRRTDLMLRTISLGFPMLLSITLTAHAQIRVTVERNTGVAATKEFKFKKVPSPAKDDAAAKATVTLLVGDCDPAGGDLNVLTDGLLPAKADEPKSNFYFASGSGGG